MCRPRIAADAKSLVPEFLAEALSCFPPKPEASSELPHSKFPPPHAGTTQVVSFLPTHYSLHLDCYTQSKSLQGLIPLDLVRPWTHPVG